MLWACGRCCVWWTPTWGTRPGWTRTGRGDSQGEDPATADRRFWLRRFTWAALFAVPTFLLAMVRGVEAKKCFPKIRYLQIRMPENL